MSLLDRTLLLNFGFKHLDNSERQKVIKQVILQVLDESWRDHLYMMDVLKTGIGLRGYNQKDPLVEYKKESFNMFQELIQRIKIESIKILNTLELNIEPEIDESVLEFLKDFEELKGKNIDEILKDAEELNQEIEKLNEETEKLIFKNVKRNDPCPCGSGKKYKNCCGKSPKF